MRKIIVLLSLLATLVVVLAACGSEGNPDASGGSEASGASEEKPTVKVGSKNFTEALILGEMYALALENAGYGVERKLNLGGTLVAHESLVNGEIDMYPEYTGTGLINILQEEPISDAQEVYDLVAAKYKENFGLVWLEPTDANNSQALATTRQVSEEYGITTLSDLAEKASELHLASVPEFEEREDGLPGLQDFYGGFDFKTVKLYDYGVKYRVILDGEADVTVGFTTDGDLTNDELVLLEDDQQFWPPYYVAPVIREELLEQDQGIADVLNEVSAHLNDEVVQQLNAAVDIDKQEYEEVAKQFLTDKGIISEN